MVLEYYALLRSVLCAKPHLRRCLKRCRHCRIFFFTDPRNAGRKDGKMSPERVEALWREFEVAGDIGGVTIDSTELTPEATSSAPVAYPPSLPA